MATGCMSHECEAAGWFGSGAGFAPLLSVAPLMGALTCNSKHSNRLRVLRLLVVSCQGCSPAQWPLIPMPLRFVETTTVTGNVYSISSCQLRDGIYLFLRCRYEKRNNIYKIFTPHLWSSLTSYKIGNLVYKSPFTRGGWMVAKRCKATLAVCFSIGKHFQCISILGAYADACPSSD